MRDITNKQSIRLGDYLEKKQGQTKKVKFKSWKNKDTTYLNRGILVKAKIRQEADGGGI